MHEQRKSNPQRLRAFENKEIDLGYFREASGPWDEEKESVRRRTP
jgi:hypothetical protein